MDFNFKLFSWSNEGAEPSDSLKAEGFKQGYKPAAGIFNKFWYLVTNAITELQEKFGSHAENKKNPHEVTAAQVGLDKVDNTPDSEKSVKFASEAGVGRKVKDALSVRFNGGSTEGTDLWTYDGSTSRSVNITPKKIKAANEVHTHETTDINGLRDKIDKIVAATTQDGISYWATVDDITELYNGLQITIIPDTTSASRNITLNVNGWGDVPIRRPLSFSTFVATSIDADKIYFLSANTPCRLMYHANYTSGGIWLMADKVKTSAQDLYGTVPIESGGTGASTIEGARTNLGISNVAMSQFANNSVEGEWYNPFISIPTYKTISDCFAAAVALSNGTNRVVLQGFRIGSTTNRIYLSGTDALTGTIFSGILYIKESDMDTTSMYAEWNFWYFAMPTGDNGEVTELGYDTVAQGYLYFL